MQRWKAACAVALVSTVSSLSADALQRAFVSSTGNDSNTASNCILTGPCRTFAAAMTVVDPNGEIVALDAAGYGSVVINKSVTITANPGFYAGISAATGNAVTINTAGVVVTLRGLNLNGVGAEKGIWMGDGAKLSVENCVISNFSIAGIQVAAAATVRISDVNIRDNGQFGLLVHDGSNTSVTRALVSGNGVTGVFVSSSSPGTTTVADVADSTLSGNGAGMHAFVNGVVAEIFASIRDSRVVQNENGVSSNGGPAGGQARFTITNNLITNSAKGILIQNSGGKGWITGNTISHNDVGISNEGGVAESAGDNAIRNNTTNTTGTISTVAKQ